MLITKIYYKYFKTATIHTVIFIGSIVKNNPSHQRKFCNARLTGYKFVNPTENNHMFNFETLLFEFLHLNLRKVLLTIRQLLICNVLSELGV